MTNRLINYSEIITIINKLTNETKNRKIQWEPVKVPNWFIRNYETNYTEYFGYKLKLENSSVAIYKQNFVSYSVFTLQLIMFPNTINYTFLDSETNDIVHLFNTIVENDECENISILEEIEKFFSDKESRINRPQKFLDKFAGCWKKLHKNFYDKILYEEKIEIFNDGTYVVKRDGLKDLVFSITKIDYYYDIFDGGLVEFNLGPENREILTMHNRDLLTGHDGIGDNITYTRIV